MTYQPLVCRQAEALRIRARNGERRPEGLTGLELQVWIMGWAEGAAERNAKAKETI